MAEGPLVGILVGSESDRERMQGAMTALDEAGVGYEFEVRSAHRNPDAVAEYARSARDRGLRVLICGAGLSAAAVKRRFEASLKRLGVDHVDLLYAHLDDPGTPFEESLGALEAALEALHPTARVQELLLAGVERVAVRADLDMELGSGRSRLERVPAGARHGRDDVLGMDVGLHAARIAAACFAATLPPETTATAV